MNEELLTTTKFLSLTPIVHEWVDELIKQKELIEKGISDYGSPLNIHSLVPFRENIEAYKSVFDKFGLKHKIYFARKANKAVIYPNEAVNLGEAVDTASYPELKECIEQGISGKRLISTAAVKNEKLIRYAIENQVTIAIDNHDECELIQSICEELETTVPINIRVSHFLYKNEILYSRFGFDIHTISDWADEFLGQDNKYDTLIYKGLHFHLNGYSTSQRSAALWQCLDATEQLRSKGFITESIDFGGGILVNYLQSKQEWDTFFEELKKAVKGEREALTFNNDGLGLQLYNNEIIGKPEVYPYYNELNKETFLEEVLTSTNEKGEVLWKKLAAYDIEVRIEPGRSLLDQTGITLARVIFNKQDTTGNNLVGLEMNRTQLRSSSSDFLLDPIHIAHNDSEEELFNAYLVGAYCLEQEFILKRKIQFKQKPQVGDWIVFVNTAGYMMHFYESRAHLFELAENLVYENGKLSIIK